MYEKLIGEGLWMINLFHRNRPQSNGN